MTSHGFLFFVCDLDENFKLVFSTFITGIFCMYLVFKLYLVYYLYIPLLSGYVGLYLFYFILSNYFIFLHFNQNKILFKHI